MPGMQLPCFKGDRADASLISSIGARNGALDGAHAGKEVVHQPAQFLAFLL